MAAPATQNPPVKTESKTAKKKKAAKPAPPTDTETSSTAPEPTPSAPAESNHGDGGYESPYIKELYKSIRNVNKKITNASKVDNIVAANPGSSLDDLVAERKINADQKAQILKKPALQASLAQLEEQIAQYKKFDQEYKAKSQAEKADFEKTLTERTSKELEEAVASTKAEAEAAATKALQDSLLLLSQFLKLAAIRRAEEEASEFEESKALEGLLAQVYSGDANAVAAMLNLIEGSDETIRSVTGEELKTTFAQIKTASLDQVPAAIEEPVETSEYPVETDPTIANAGLTELNDPPAATLTNGHTESHEVQGIPQNSGFGEGAANAAAEANWDNNNDLSTSQEWVEVPRDTAETETGITATPAAPSNVQSWADDQPESPAETASAPPAAAANDGFQEISRNRGGRGSFRGGNRGGRGDHRGRGNYRGDGHRGRGGRGGGGNRGGRRPEESS